MNGFVQQIVDSGIVTSGTAKNPTANTTKGNTIVISSRSLSSTTTTSVADSQGNTYTVDVPSGAGTTNIAIISGYLANALTTGDTITVTATGSINFQAYEFSGIIPRTPINKSGSATGTAITSLASSNTGVQTNPNIMAITVIGTAGASGGFTNPAAYTEVLPPTTTGMDMGYVFVNSTVGRAPSWTWVTSQAAATAVATYPYTPDTILRNRHITKPHPFSPGIAR